jgi:hypothetical protein
LNSLLAALTDCEERRMQAKWETKEQNNWAWLTLPYLSSASFFKFSSSGFISASLSSPPQMSLTLWRSRLSTSLISVSLFEHRYWSILSLTSCHYISGKLSEVDSWENMTTWTLCHLPFNLSTSLSKSFNWLLSDLSTRALSSRMRSLSDSFCKSCVRRGKVYIFKQ